VLGTSGGAQEVWYAYNGKVHFVPWPADTSGVNLTASVLVQGTPPVPHVLGTGVKSSGSFWAIWKINPGGSAMVPLTDLPGWGACSHLVANNSGKLAFSGHHYSGAPDMPSTHLGFVVGGVPQAADLIPNLS